MASYDPLESGRAAPPSDGPDDHVPHPPRIRRDDELPAVTGELSHDLVLGQRVAERQWPDDPERSLHRDQHDDRSPDDITPIATRTIGGTVVTFPPQSAPGFGPGEPGRVTASIPATPPHPFDPAGPTSPSPATNRGDEAGRTLATPAPPTPPSADGTSVPAPPTIPSAPGLDRTGSETPSESGRPRVRARKNRDVGPAVNAERGPGFLTEPEQTDSGADRHRTGPWHLIDPTDLARSTESAEPEAAAPATSDPEVSEPGDDADRLADLEYLFASRTIDVGPAELDAILSLSSESGSSEIDSAEIDSSAEAHSFEGLSPVELPEIDVASATVLTDGPVQGNPPIDQPVDHTLVHQPLDHAPMDRALDPDDEFDSDERLDELLADFSAATGGTPDPAPDIEPPALPASRAEIAPAGDATVPGTTFGQRPVQRRLRSDDTPPPGAAGSRLFAGARPGRLEPPVEPAQKSPAEVFASETSLLPARTRRGDRPLLDDRDDQGRWFNHSSELPIVQVAKEWRPAARPRPVRRVLRRMVMVLLILAALAGFMYVALNSIYL